MNAIFILQGKGPDKALCELFFDMTPPEEKRTKNSSRRYKKISRKNYFYYSSHKALSGPFPCKMKMAFINHNSSVHEQIWKMIKQTKNNL
jgi:hypothetical protein